MSAPHPRRLSINPLFPTRVQHVLTVGLQGGPFETNVIAVIKHEQNPDEGPPCRFQARSLWSGDSGNTHFIIKVARDGFQWLRGAVICPSSIDKPWIAPETLIVAES